MLDISDRISFSIARGSGAVVMTALVNDTVETSCNPFYHTVQYYSLGDEYDKDDLVSSYLENLEMNCFELADDDEFL